MSGQPVDAASGPGFFGKVPGVGDFVRRGLPGSFVEPWDAWVRALLQSGTAALGDDWLETYLTSPIWRFALTPGACGPAAVAGVMVPSLDAVGRCFPLVLAETVADARVSAQVLDEADSWYARLEEAALSALGETFDIEQFTETVSASGFVSSFMGPAEHAGEPGPAFVLLESPAAGEPAPEDRCELARRVAAIAGRPLGLWRTVHGSQRIGPVSLLLAMTPAKADGATLFAGHGLSAERTPSPAPSPDSPEDGTFPVPIP
jgi:type VI secretion system protein ImpM